MRLRAELMRLSAELMRLRAGRMRVPAQRAYERLTEMAGAAGDENSHRPEL